MSQWFHEQEPDVQRAFITDLGLKITRQMQLLWQLERDGHQIPVDFIGMLEQLAKDQASIIEAIRKGRVFTKQVPLIIGGPWKLPPKSESWFTRIKRKWGRKA